MSQLLQILLGTVIANGATIELYRDEAICLPPAMGAMYVAKDGKKTPGCWKTDGEMVVVVWLDADVSQFPVGLVKPAERL